MYGHEASKEQGYKSFRHGRALSVHNDSDQWFAVGWVYVDMPDRTPRRPAAAGAPLLPHAGGRHPHRPRGATEAREAPRHGARHRDGLRGEDRRGDERARRALPEEQTEDRLAPARAGAGAQADELSEVKRATLQAPTLSAWNNATVSKRERYPKCSSLAYLADVVHRPMMIRNNLLYNWQS